MRRSSRVSAGRLSGELRMGDVDRRDGRGRGGERMNAERMKIESNHRSSDRVTIADLIGADRMRLMNRRKAIGRAVE